MPVQYAPIYLTWLGYPIFSLSFFASTWLYSFVDDGHYQGCDFLRFPIILSFVILGLCVVSCLQSLKLIRKHHSAVISKIIPAEHIQPKSTLFGMPLDIPPEEPADYSSWIRWGYQKHWWYVGSWSAFTLFYCVLTYALRVAAEPNC